MKALGIILAGGNNYRMRELSDKRAIAAMPVAADTEPLIRIKQYEQFSYSASGSTDTVQFPFLKRTFEFLKMVGFW